MFELCELCEHMSVYRRDAVPDGFVVEECGQFYPELLDAFCIVCREHEIQRIEEWIRENMHQNVEHCIKMFYHAPEKFLAFLCSTANAASYTDEFVKAAGGVQQFLDKYAAGFSEGLSAVPDAGRTLTENFEIPSVQEKPDASSAGIKNTGNVFAGWSDDAMNLPTGLLQESLPETQEDVQPSVFVQKETGPVIVEEVVKRIEVTEEVHKIQEYNPSLIREISDEDILESLMYLRELDLRISLDGLDPGMVLSDHQLKQAYSMLESYPPAVIKNFVLELIRQVDSNVERIRVSSLLDDFASYLCEKQEVAKNG